MKNKDAKKLKQYLKTIAEMPDLPYLSKEETGMEFGRKELARDLLEDFFSEEKNTRD